MTISAARAPDWPFARAVLGLPDNRLTCHECLADLPIYIEAELGGIAWREEYRLLKRHILLCPGCSATYFDLLRVALLEQSGQLFRPEHLPLPDLSFLPEGRPGGRRDD